MNNIQDLKPFKRLCVTIGNLPTAYIESMSYYECITYLVNYLTREVVPTVNNNSEVVKELQSYVEHYFDNLNVQEEINNKLDEMAESGVLADIINEEIFTDLNNQVLQNTNDIETLETNLSLLTDKKYIFIGDSYGTGDNELQEHTNSYMTMLPTYLNLSEGDYYTDSDNGSGFANGLTFKNQLIRVGANISDKDEITDIIVIGGYNDQGNSVSTNINAIGDFCSYVKLNYPNAQVSIACVGWSKVYSNRQNIALNVIPAYTKCGQFGAKYLKNCEYILHDYSLFSDDNYHPNQNGQNELAKYLTDAILSGSCNVVRSFVNPTTAKYDNSNTISPAYILQCQNNDRITLLIGQSYFTIGTPVNLSRDSRIDLLKFTDGLVMGAGLEVFRNFQNLFCADSTDTNEYDLPISFTLLYDSTNNCCTLRMIVDSTKETASNVSAFVYNDFSIELPALFC